MTSLRAFAPLPLALFTTVFAKHGGTDDDSGSESDSDDDDTPTSSSGLSTVVSQSSTTTPSTPTTSSPPILQFLAPQNATTCGNSTFTWKYAGLSDVALTITVTNERAVGIQQGNQSLQLISRTVTNTVSSMAETMLWKRVDVPPGPYVALAFDTQRTVGINAQSSPFFVFAGSDTSCLVTSSQISTTVPPAPSTTSHTTETSNTNHRPLGGLSSGALAGTVIGVIVGVLLLLLAFTFPSFLRHSLPRQWSRRSSRPGGPYLLF